MQLLKFFFLSFVFFFMHSLSNAQQKYNGYILLKAGDTLKGSILIPIKTVKGVREFDFSEINRHIDFLDSAGKVKTYKAKTTFGFGIHDEDVNYDYLSFNVEPPGVGKKNLFLKRVVDGDISLFEDYHLITRNYGVYDNKTYGVINNNLSRTEPNTSFYIVINNSAIQIHEKVFKKDYLKAEDLKKIFKDYPKILEKINDDIQWWELKEIITQYNASRLK